MNVRYRSSFLAIALAAAFVGVSPAMAQWQVPNNAVPLGYGSGTGFKFAPNGTTNQAFMGNSAGSPGFRALSGADLPAPFTGGTASGNTSKFVTTTGTLSSGHCSKYDANGNSVDAGAACGTVTSLSAGTGMSFSTITTSGSVAIDKATAANFTGNTSNKVLTPDGVWGAAALVSATITTSYTPDFSAGTNFLLTTTSATNFTLNNPTNAKPGQTGCIYFSQSSGTPSSITFGTNWLTPGGKSGLNLAQVATALNRLCYFVVTSSVIDFTLSPQYLQ